MVWEAGTVMIAIGTRRYLRGARSALAVLLDRSLVKSMGGWDVAGDANTEQTSRGCET